MVRRRAQAKVTKVQQPIPQKPEIEEETYFLNPDSVSPHLYCCICQEVFKEPWRAPCGHSFCKQCILDWLAKNSICPTDRKPVTVAQLHHDFLVQSIIDDYVVACPWRALGCHHVGPLHQLKQHRKVCPLNPNAMPKVLQDYSVGLLSTAQQELQRKLVQRSLAAASTLGRQSLPAATTAPTSSASSGSAAARQSSGSAFDQLLSELVEDDDDSGASNDAVDGGAAATSAIGGSSSASGSGAAASTSANGSGAATSTANGSGAAASSSANGSGAATSSANGGGAAAASSSASGSGAAADASFEDDDESANLPGGQLPSLRMRLYMNSQAQGRSEFVSFLENINTPPELLQLPQSFRRFCEPPDGKRPRLDDD